MKLAFLRAGLSAALLPFLAGGCAGSLFQTKAAPPTMYLLSAGNASPTADAAAASAELAVDLAILKPRVRAGLDTDRIAALYPDRRLDYFADARWSGPLDEVMQDLIVQVFHTRAGMRNVSGDASAFASAFWLEVMVTDRSRVSRFGRSAHGASASASAHRQFRRAAHHRAVRSRCRAAGGRESHEQHCRGLQSGGQHGARAACGQLQRRAEVIQSPVASRSR